MIPKPATAGDGGQGAVAQGGPPPAGGRAGPDRSHELDHPWSLVGPVPHTGGFSTKNTPKIIKK
eukprot:5871230-Pyramimonas_sp.AAC.1